MPDVGSRARRRIAWRLLPLVFVLYVVAYIDRVNVSDKHILRHIGSIKPTWCLVSDQDNGKAFASPNIVNVEPIPARGLIYPEW
jgi:hypothetical protein